jgi:hydrogenase nickel incorporation protein HypA/HybF
MHEAAAMQTIVSTLLEQAAKTGANRVTKVELVLGASSHHTEEGVRQYFSALTAGTLAQHAELAITWLPATYQCLNCRHQFPVLNPAAETDCPWCKGVALEVAHKDDWYLSKIELEK